MRVIRWVGAMVYNVNARAGKSKSPEQLLSIYDPYEQEEKERLRVIDKKQLDKIFNEWMPPIYEEGRKKDTTSFMKRHGNRGR